MTPPDWPRAGGGGLAPQVTIPPPPPRANPLAALHPVTEAMLQRPPDADWLLWRRTYEALGFSPLKAINNTNVRDLRPAWSW
jgi:glucose dehydrogenase